MFCKEEGYFFVNRREIFFLLYLGVVAVQQKGDDVTHCFFIFQIQFTLFNVLPVCFFIEHG